jgi:hypothetical protein
MGKVISQEGEDGNFAYLTRCLDEKVFHERAFETFANQIENSFLKPFFSFL